MYSLVWGRSSPAVKFSFCLWKFNNFVNDINNVDPISRKKSVLHRNLFTVLQICSKPHIKFTLIWSSYYHSVTTQMRIYTYHKTYNWCAKFTQRQKCWKFLHFNGRVFLNKKPQVVILERKTRTNCFCTFIQDIWKDFLLHSAIYMEHKTSFSLSAFLGTESI